MKHKELHVNDIAPQFGTTDAMGKKVALADYAKSHVLLVFLRYSGCPLCNLTLHRLTLEHPMLAKNGCEVIAFVQSDNDSIQQNIYERHAHKPQFPIIGDPGRTFYDSYGVKTSFTATLRSVIDIPYWIKSAYGLGFKQTKIDGNLFLVPALFLIGPGKQKIIKADYGTSFYDHSTFTSIYEPLTFK